MQVPFHFNSIDQRPLGDSGLQVPSLGIRLQEYVHGPSDFNHAVDAGMSLVDTFPLLKTGGRADSLNPARSRATLLARIGQPVGGEESDGCKTALHRELSTFDFSYDAVMRAFAWTCARLGADFIDIVALSGLGVTDQGALNDAVTFPIAMDSGYKALEELRANGNIKALALASNDIDACCRALELGDWDALVLSHRYTLLEQWPLFNLLPRCINRRTSVIIDEPFNGGILAGSTRWNKMHAPDYVIARVRNIEHICNLHEVPLAAAALQFPGAHPAVSSVIPTLGEPEDVEQLMAWWSHAIPPEFWNDLKAAGVMHEEAPIPLH